MTEELSNWKLKPGYMELAMAGNYSTIGIQLLLTRPIDS